MKRETKERIPHEGKDAVPVRPVHAARAPSDRLPRPGAGPTATQTPPVEHEPITMMSGGKDSSGFIAYVKSVYPEISIQLVPHRDANPPVHV